MSAPERTGESAGSAVPELPFWSVLVTDAVALLVLIAVAPGTMKGPWARFAVGALLLGTPYVIWWVAARRLRYPSREVMGERLRARHLPAVFCTTLAVLGVRVVLVAGLVLTDLIPESWQRHDAPETLPLKLANVILVVIIGPCAEEIFFRGLMFRRLLRRTRPVYAALISSMVFGLMHLDPIGSTLSGLAMVVLYVRSRSLWVPTLAHMLNNLLATLPSFAEPARVDSLPDSVWLLVPGLLLSLAGLAWLFRGWRHDITTFAHQHP